MTTLSLTPGEALTLLNPNEKQGREAIKVSLMWLLAKGALTATWEGKPGLFAKLARRLHLRPSNRPVGDLPREMAELVGIVRHAGNIENCVRAAQIRYGHDLSGFQSEHLLPSLMQQRLIEPRTERFLMMFSRTRYYRTEAGEALRRRVGMLLARAHQIPGFADRDRAQTAALAATLGGLVFLVPRLRPHFNDIAAAMRRPHPTDSAHYVDGSSQAASGRSEPDPVTLPFSDFDPGTLDAFDAGVAAFDSSFDAATSDAGSGGGDGGGGGGGGSD